MQYRPLGRTGLSVSEIGYGAWGIGGQYWIGAQEDESVQALHRAIELGVNFIDTARGYGESERIVGQVVREYPRDSIYVATKVPPANLTWPAAPGVPADVTFPGKHIRESLETSLAVSGLDAFDVVQFHVWLDEWIGQGNWLETIAALKQEGKIRFFGVSIHDYKPDSVLKLVRSGDVDTVQLIYNAFHLTPEEELLPACAEHGAGVIVRVPLDEGGLTGTLTAQTTFPEGDWRNGYFGGDRLSQVEQRVDALLADTGVERERLPEVALRYVLDAPEVSTVIPGMRTVRNVERNAAVSDGVRLSDELRTALRRHRWERNFYEAP
ncbi:aldo/keto reductase [Allorhizocola rhizosphaerae]|uniref:aldo/keto reductase n=1 Tax=Allorhizocola rhizosphaerae TaxID=1872709 RepID=UPI000E3CF1C1|nr:aldo/keto reductase [Allorhizocola rhizosphaerae]